MQAAKKQTYEVYRWNGQDWVVFGEKRGGFVEDLTFPTYCDALIFARRQLKERPGDYLIRGEDGREWAVR
jgi:hypothetical protein